VACYLIAFGVCLAFLDANLMEVQGADCFTDLRVIIGGIENLRQG
jgi:hypothetical protein